MFTSAASEDETQIQTSSQHVFSEAMIISNMPECFFHVLADRWTLWFCFEVCKFAMPQFYTDARVASVGYQAVNHGTN